MVRLANLEFRYREGEFQLRVPELDVARGETVAIVGPSGCGKTTWLNLIVTLGTDYWEHLRVFIRRTMLEHATIDPSDLDLVQLTDSPDEVIEMILRDSRGQVGAE